MALMHGEFSNRKADLRQVREILESQERCWKQKRGQIMKSTDYFLSDDCRQKV
jgi:hypothetical protein